MGEVAGRLVIVGGGVVGLSCAWQAAAHAFTAPADGVVLVDPQPGSGASWVAGGMLAPVTEAWPGEEALLELGSDSLVRWPHFAAELAAMSRADPGLRTEGTLVAAVDSGDREELDALATYLAGHGRPAQRLSGRELRALEPSLGPAVRAGLSVPGDLAVDNRALLAALLAAVANSGVRVLRQRVERVRDDGRSVTGVVLDDGTTLDASAVLVAAGAWSAALHPALARLVRPVKGEILRLRARRGALPPPSRTLRALVQGHHVYLVPRDDGRVVLGATQTEVGFDPDVTVGGVRDLLADAERVLPGIAEYALEETAASFRPGSPDNLPLLGGLGPDGLLVATGHGRNGILLAPVTADTVAALLSGGEVPAVAAVAHPGRFEVVPSVGVRTGVGT